VIIFLGYQTIADCSGLLFPSVMMLDIGCDIWALCQYYEFDLSAYVYLMLCC